MTPVPHSIEAEAGLLGSCLTDPRIIPAALRSGVSNGSFFHDAHATIWGAALGLHDDGRPIDMITLGGSLRDAGALEAVGGPAALSVLLSFPTAANWRQYAATVAEKAERRALMASAGRLIELAQNESEELDTVREAAQQIGLESSRAMVADKGAVHIKTAAMEFLDLVQAAQLGTDPRYRIEMGMPEFEKLTHNLPPGTMVVVGAQTSVGKTAFGLQAACGVAFHQTDKRSALVVSLEMTAQKLAGRVAAAQANISLSKLNARKPALSEYEFAELARGMNRIAASDLYLWTPQQTPTAAQVAAMIRMQKIQRPDLSLVVVDYLQLIAPRNPKDNMERQFSDSCEALMRAAVGLNVTVIALSQLNDDGRLFGARAIGHHARVVAILTRPEIDPDEGDTGERTLFLDKNSEGQAAVSIPLHFAGAYQRFNEKPKDKK